MDDNNQNGQNNINGGYPQQNLNDNQNVANSAQPVGVLNENPNVQVPQPVNTATQYQNPQFVEPQAVQPTPQSQPQPVQPQPSYQASQQPVQPMPQTTSYQGDFGGNNNQSEGNKKNNKMIFIIVGALLAVVLIIVLILSLGKGKNNINTGNDTNNSGNNIFQPDNDTNSNSNTTNNSNSNSNTSDLKLAKFGEYGEIVDGISMKIVGTEITSAAVATVDRRRLLITVSIKNNSGSDVVIYGTIGKTEGVLVDSDLQLTYVSKSTDLKNVKESDIKVTYLMPQRPIDLDMDEKVILKPGEEKEAKIQGNVYGNDSWDNYQPYILIANKTETYFAMR